MKYITYLSLVLFISCNLESAQQVPVAAKAEPAKSSRLVLDDAHSIESHINTIFGDKELNTKKLSVRSAPAPINAIVELIGMSAGIDFVIDQDISGITGTIHFEGKTAGEILKILCNRNTPRLAVIKQCNVWRIGLHDKITQHLKALYGDQFIDKVFSLNHVRCDEPLKHKVEEMWQRITKIQKSDLSYCSIDLESKKVFVHGTKKHIQKMEQFLREIDFSIAQVRIDALVAVVDRKYEHQLGFNWSGIYNKASSVGRGFEFLGVGVAPKNSPTGSSDVYALNLFNKATNTLRIPFVFGGSDLSLQRLNVDLRAAENESKAKILLKPSVLTSHNETAEILIGKSIPIKTMVEDMVQGKLRNVQTVNYQDIGTILNVRPIVSPDRKSAQLDIWVEDSSIAENVPTDQAPVIKKIRTKNKVTLRSGQTTVIGGLMLNRDETGTSEMPILAKLPLIGRIFRSSQRSKEDNQMLIFITPTIVA